MMRHSVRSLMAYFTYQSRQSAAGCTARSLARSVGTTFSRISSTSHGCIIHCEGHAVSLHAYVIQRIGETVFGKHNLINFPPVPIMFTDAPVVSAAAIYAAAEATEFRDCT